MMRVAMGDAIREHGLTKDMVGTDMGWAKFHAITTAFHEEMKKGEVTTLLKKAQKLSLADLKEFVKEVKVERTGCQIEKRTTRKYVLLNEMAEVVDNSINLAKEIMGVDDEVLAMEYIMAEWGMNHNPKLRDKIMESLHGEAVEVEDEEPTPKARKKSAATKKKEKTVAKNEKAVASKKKAVVEEDEDEFDDDEAEEADADEDEEEEAPAPKAKAKAVVKGGKKALPVVDEDEFDDDDEDDDDEFEEEV